MSPGTSNAWCLESKEALSWAMNVGSEGHWSVALMIPGCPSLHTGYWFLIIGTFQNYMVAH